MRLQEIAKATPAQIQDAPPPPPNPPAPGSLGVDGDFPPSIEAVYTEDEFVIAINAGVRDIEIRAHLDFRSINRVTPVVDPSPPFTASYIGTPTPMTRSIRVCFM